MIFGAEVDSSETFVRNEIGSVNTVSLQSRFQKKIFLPTLIKTFLFQKESQMDLGDRWTDEFKMEVGKKFIFHNMTK